MRRIARRYSLCADDAEDALQHALENLLRDPPGEDPRELIKWTQAVVKHKALAIRQDRERTLVDPVPVNAERNRGDWVSLLPAEGDGPPERVIRREAIARSREALQALKPQELRALTLLAEGYSYLEIEQITGFSQTKINRCLAEGRERFRKLILRSEAGQRCAELQPLLSAFCDGQAEAEEVAELREHLRACAHCRATLRAYRAAPAAAAALAPTLSVDRSLWERVHDSLTEFAARFSGGGGGVSQVAASGGSGGMGIAALAKVAAVCIGAAGGAAACVATGLVPAPPGLAHPDQTPRVERHQAAAPAHEVTTPVEPAPAPEPTSPEPQPQHQQASAETEPVASEVAATDSGAVEYVPPPSPEPAPAPEPAGGGGDSPAGEFGP